MRMETVFQQAVAVENLPKVEVRNLAVYYGKFRALKEINLTVQEKRITAIIEG